MLIFQLASRQFLSSKGSLQFSKVSPNFGQLWSRYSRLPDVATQECEKHPPPLDECGRPIEKKMSPLTVTVLGCNCLAGATLAALLKKNKDIELLKLYDQEDICGIGYDISHISTSCKVLVYSGYKNLPPALENAHLVVICGGCQTDPCLKQLQVFQQNAGYVRNLAAMCAEFNPDAFLAVVTEPVNFLIPMIHQEYLKAGRNNGHKIAGVVNVNIMAANTIVGTYANVDKSKVGCPIIGGNCPKTLVPLLSQLKVTLSGFNPEKVSEEIAYYSHKVLQLKLHDFAGPCYAITAFAASKFIGTVINGLKGKTEHNKEYAFIKQFGKIEKFLPYMTTLVQFGKEGIECSSFPKLNPLERRLLKEAYRTLRNQINAGESFVNGRIFTTVILKKSCEDVCHIVEKESLEEPKEEEEDPKKERPKIFISGNESIIGRRVEDMVVETFIEKRRKPCEEKECEKARKPPPEQKK